MRASFLLFSFLFSFYPHAHTTQYYKAELAAYKENMKERLIFDKDANNLFRSLDRDIESASHLSLLKRILLFPFLEGVVITKASMPKLYDYVESLCFAHNMSVPTIFISTSDNLFNAMAVKLLLSAGGIMIGQRLLNDCSDDEIEAVVAHEVGHVNIIMLTSILLLYLYWFSFIGFLIKKF